MKSYFFLNLCCDSPYEIWLVFKYCVIYRYLFLGFDIVNQVEKSTWRNQILDIRILKFNQDIFLVENNSNLFLHPANVMSTARAAPLAEFLELPPVLRNTKLDPEMAGPLSPKSNASHSNDLRGKGKKKHLKKNAEK